MLWRKLILANPFQSGLRLPAPAKAELRKDNSGLPEVDPGIECVIDEGIAWLCRAQDNSTTADGGVARDYSLISGWSTSYPETTGYIIPTLLQYADDRNDDDIRKRAIRMLDWFVKIQFPDGGFQGGKIDSTPVVPVTFNTGQILLGLAAGAQRFDRYREPMRRAAQWLVNSLDADGCWRSHPTPFAKPGEKAYETHVSWGLLEAARVDSNEEFGEAALRNIRWAITKQRENGWIEDCCLSDKSCPLTHTLGYALRGILEGYLYSKENDLLTAARRTADGLLTGLSEDGYLPGCFHKDWTPGAKWVCLTGAVQIAHSWLLLYRETGDVKYRDAGFAANGYVRRTINVDGRDEIRGAVKGSFPVDGEYGPYEFLNWAAKFCIDSQIVEREIRSSQ